MLASWKQRVEGTRAKEHHKQPLRSTLTGTGTGRAGLHQVMEHVVKSSSSACTWKHRSHLHNTTCRPPGYSAGSITRRQLYGFWEQSLRYGGISPWVSARWRAAAEHVISCSISALKKLFRLTDEWNSCEKQVSCCLSPPSCKEMGISVHHIKGTLDPVWSIPPPNYYTLKGLIFWYSQVKRAKSISGKVRKNCTSL